MVARSTSASALPSRVAGLGLISPSAAASKSMSGAATPTRTLPETPGATTPNRLHLTGSGSGAASGAASGATSPLLGGVDFHPHSAAAAAAAAAGGPAQLRSTTHSPAFLSGLSSNSIPWLALPGAAATPGGLGGAESPTNMFGRRRSDTGMASSEASTPVLGHPDKLGHTSPQQQENPHPQPPQAQHHPHHYHLLSHQDLAALSRNNSPMPLNEALPSYLRRNVEPKMHHPMERSLSNPGSSSIQSAPVSPFMLPIHPAAYNKAMHMRYPHGNASDLDLSLTKELPAKPRA
ncbi:hypothetical protein BGX31_003381 [Mortierella sp. GBA43]|nr:hypothetical protein BGX31_003381 [Mortierella sp. GBA43]